MVLEKLHHHFYMSETENAKHFPDQLNYLLTIKQMLYDVHIYEKTKNKKKYSSELLCYTYLSKHFFFFVKGIVYLYDYTQNIYS